jgi:DNA-directed RNA polymerase II subunit RPB1
VCTPYNADFDGDEMNMHVPQNYDTRAELKYICHVPRQVVTPKANKPVMGIVQDALLGTCLFTLRDTFLTKEQVMNLIMWIPDWKGIIPMPAILKPQLLWTGKQIISLIIPEKVTMHRGPENWFDKEDEVVLIQGGDLLCGVMTKEIVGDGGKIKEIKIQQKSKKMKKIFLIFRWRSGA